MARGLHQLVPPVALAFWRWLIAGVVLAPFALPHVVRDWSIVKSCWVRMLLFGLVGTTSFAVLGYWALQYTTSMNAVLLNGVVPVFTVLMGAVVLRERVSGRIVIAVLAAVAGTLLVATHGEPQRILSLEFNRGDVILIAAIFIWSAYTVGLRWRPRAMHGLTFMFVSTALGVAFCAPLFMLEHLASGAPTEVSPATVGAVLYLALFPSITAYVCWNYAVPRVGHNIAGMFSNVTVVLGTAASIVFLGEQPHWHHLAALGLTCLAVYFASGRRT